MCTRGIVSLLMLKLTYIHAMALHVHTQGRFNNIYTILVMVTSVKGVMKMGNIGPRAGIQPTYLAF